MEGSLLSLLLSVKHSQVIQLTQKYSQESQFLWSVQQDIGKYDMSRLILH